MDKKFSLTAQCSLCSSSGYTLRTNSLPPTVYKPFLKPEASFPVELSSPPVLDASLSVMLILYLAGRLVHKCYLEMNKSFQLCWVAIVRAAAVGLKTDGLIRMEDLAPI